MAENPYEKVLWSIRRRMERQQASLKETQKELDGAQAMYDRHNQDQLELQLAQRKK